MLKYELLFILPGTLDDKQVAARAGEVVDMVKMHATDVEPHTMGKNRLAYPVKQIRYGYYFTVTFNAEKDSLKKLQEKISLTRDILRGIFTHFNIDLTPLQSQAYAPEVAHSAKVEHFSEEKIMTEAKVPAVAAAPEKETLAKSPNSRDLEKLDMAAISKKLDDLMSGDVIPGV